MARQPRIEFEGALHHVMSRGNDGIPIFRDDEDRQRFVSLLAEEIGRSRWVLHDYCLMSNHYHLAIATPECTLSTGMHRLLARYVQYFNRRHRRRGHLFQERFKNVLVQEETHGIVLSRYLALNPVRAGICARPEDSIWSSYAARAGLARCPAWLSIEPLAAQFGAEQASRQHAYREFVLAAIGCEDDYESQVVDGMFVGGPEWTQDVQKVLDLTERSEEHLRTQVHPGRPELEDAITAVASTFDTTRAAIVAGRGTIERRLVAFLAFEEGLVPLRRIARALGLMSAGRVSDVVRQYREQVRHDPQARELLEACRSRMRRRPPPFLLPPEVPFRFARSYHRLPARSKR